MLVLIRGIPGTGKSTLAKMFADRMGFEHLEADQYFVDHVTGEYKFNRNMISHAHTYCVAYTDDFLNHGKDVVVSNTFVHQWEMEKYREMATRYNIGLTVIVLTEEYGNTHGVPKETVDRMRSEFEYNTL